MQKFETVDETELSQISGGFVLFAVLLGGYICYRAGQEDARAGR